MEQQESNENIRSKTLKLFLLAMAFGLVVIWLINTPPGLLGKTDAIAYAICHRIGSNHDLIENTAASVSRHAWRLTRLCP